MSVRIAAVTPLSFFPHTYPAPSPSPSPSFVKLPFSSTRQKNFFRHPPQLSHQFLKFALSCHKPNWVVFDDSNNSEVIQVEEGKFIVVNFYRFVFIQHPQQEVSKHLSFLQDRDIHGRIYVNEQGINAQYSGPSKDALAYVAWLRDDHRFSDILVQISPAIQGHAFPKLKLRYKPSLIQLEGGISHLPLLDPLMRATPLTPVEWRNRLEAVNKFDITSGGSPEKDFILLDVRNGYEWDIGHFRGAQRPEVDCFRSTSFGLSRSELRLWLHYKPTDFLFTYNPLANISKEKTDILMYCTGGIRCDVYSAILRQKGFKNLYTLKGGVSHYLQSEGPVEWIGNLFVFDSRLSLPPSSEEDDARIEEIKGREDSNSKFAKCYICASQISELRHRNCANLDCNLLFLCCANCMADVKGCCSLNCTYAPRLRPLLPGHQRYAKWHHYRDQELQTR